MEEPVELHNEEYEKINKENMENISLLEKKISDAKLELDQSYAVKMGKILDAVIPGDVWSKFKDHYHSDLFLFHQNQFSDTLLNKTVVIGSISDAEVFEFPDEKFSSAVEKEKSTSSMKEYGFSLSG